MKKYKIKQNKKNTHKHKQSERNKMGITEDELEGHPAKGYVNNTGVACIKFQRGLETQKAFQHCKFEKLGIKFHN